MDRTAPEPLLIVGGWGLVGSQVVPMLRQRHPDLPIVLAGRHPERAVSLAAAWNVATTALELGAPHPLARIDVRPRAVLSVVGDPGDHLLTDAMRLGIPIADIDRAAGWAVLDATMAAARERPTAPVLLSGAWMAGISALCAAAMVRAVDGACERVEIVSLASSDDRIGQDSWGFSERLPWPFWSMKANRRRPVQPLSEIDQVVCADGAVRASGLVGTLEQTSLPVTLGVPTVETRLVLHSAASLYLLAGLKRSGALRMLAAPSLSGVRAAVLQRSGTGDIAGLSVTAVAEDGQTARCDLLDVHGQSHLSAVGATRAAERLLSGSLPSGISFPEQAADPEDLQSLRDAGVVVRVTGPHGRSVRQLESEVFA